MHSHADFCTVMFSANLVGILFARSLHYQFYAWYAHQAIFLAFHTPYDLYQKWVTLLFPQTMSWPLGLLLLRLGILAAIEFGWNTFPSTDRSSIGLTFANALLLAGVYYGHRVGIGERFEKGSPRSTLEKQGNRKKIEWIELSKLRASKHSMDNGLLLHRLVCHCLLFVNGSDVAVREIETRIKTRLQYRFNLAKICAGVVS